MSTRIHVSQIVSRVRSGVSEMSYAQRRVFENQTGIAITDAERRSAAPATSAPRPSPAASTSSRRCTRRISGPDGAERLAFRR